MKPARTPSVCPPHRTWPILGSNPESAVSSSLISLVLTLLAPTAIASGEAEEAEIAFQLGLAAYSASDYDQALFYFLASNRVAPNPAVAFNIARAYARTNRFAEAYRWYTIAREGITEPAVLRTVDEGMAAILPQVVIFDLTSDPEGALVYVDSKDLGSLGATPLRVALVPSEQPYTFIFEKPGFEDTLQPSEGPRGKTVPVSATLRHIVGFVGVEGTEGAEVKLGAPDGPLLCVTPCEAEVEPGSRVLYVTREGYRDAVLQLEVAPDSRTTTSVLLRPNTGSVLVDTSETGAKVEIDGQVIGYTPTVAQMVPTGVRQVRISRPGFATIEREVNVETDKQVQLDNVVLVPTAEVSAVSRRTEQVALAPSSVTLITRDELTAFRYPTLYEALRGVRGFAMTYDSIYGSAAIRGLGQANDFGNRMLVLSDGATLNDNILYQSFISYDGQVGLDDVTQIEVVRGPGSLLYGTGAVSGVVNLVGPSVEAENGARVGASLYEDVQSGSAQLHLARGEVGIHANVAGAISDGRTETIDPRGPADPPLLVSGFDAFMAGTTTGRVWLGDATLQWFHTWRSQDIPTGTYGTVLGNPNDNNHWNDLRSMAELRYEPQLSDKTQLLTRTWFQRYQYDGSLPYGRYVSVERYVGVQLGAESRLVSNPIEPLQLQVGAQGNVNPVVTLVGDDHRIQGAVVNYLDESEPYTIGAVYALAELMPASSVRVTLGSRADYWSTFGLALSPRAAVVLQPGSRDTLKLIAGRAFRAPSIYELYYNIPAAQLRPDFDGTVLLPETVWSGELEYSHAFDDLWTGLLAAHTSQATNLIETVQAPGEEAGVVTYRNSDLPINVVGGDVELRRSFQRGYMVSGYYSALYSAYKGGELLPNAPLHSAALKVIIPLGGSARLAVRALLEGPRRIDLASDARTEPALVGDMVLSGSLHELGFDYAFGVYNLLDTEYSQPVTDTFPFRTVPQQGRSLLATLSKRF
jgi:outer membrane receptor for ferrienterochelin and colicins